MFYFIGVSDVIWRPMATVPQNNDPSVAKGLRYTGKYKNFNLMSSIWPKRGANLMGTLESQALVSYYLPLHSKALLAIIKNIKQ